MFDIGFSELLVVAVVALIVIGPEKLPKTARTLGHLFGRLQRYVADVKADVTREMELDELKRLRSEVTSAAQGLKDTVESAARDVEAGTREVESQLNAAASDAPAAPSELPALTTPPAEPAAELPRQPALPGFDKI
jgi:sec-independent protein translocase protein TatB